MPPRENKKPNPLALVMRAGSGPGMSIVKFGAGLQTTSALTRLIFRNIHLALMRKEEITVINSTENSYATEQRDGAAPAMKYVRVAVKAPAFEERSARNMWWDESVSWEASSEKWKGGLSARQQKAKRPPYVLAQIPYDEWRKHYAKDKTGKYRGTEAPAENCILLPEDEIKYRSEMLQIEDDQLAGNEDAPPPVEQVKRSATFPQYQEAGPILAPEMELAPAASPQDVEAVFIEDDGHTASQNVEVPKAGLSLPTSPTSSTFLGPSTSPTSPAS